jgi:hypothetical protein
MEAKVEAEDGFDRRDGAGKVFLVFAQVQDGGV